MLLILFFRINFINSAFSEYKKDSSSRVLSSHYKTTAPSIEGKLANIEQCINDLTQRVSGQMQKSGSSQLLKNNLPQSSRNHDLFYQRSISEHEPLDNLRMSGSALVPSAPRFYMQRPSFKVSGSQSSTNLVSVEQPRKFSEKSGIVKKAVHKFKKGSLDAGAILKDRRSFSMEEAPLLNLDEGIDATDKPRVC